MKAEIEQPCNKDPYFEIRRESFHEGYEACERDYWQSFRREAAKDILCAMLSGNNTLCATGRIGEREVSNAIMLANELIRQLKEEKNK